jgi:hypothetical protein
MMWAIHQGVELFGFGKREMPVEVGDSEAYIILPAQD